MAGQALKVRLLRPGARLPMKATDGASGFDLSACIEGDGYIDVGPDVTLVPTGLAIEAPRGYDVQIRPRSGLGRQGVSIIYGTIDSDYRGELLVSMHTFGSRQTYRVHHGDRIAQLVISRLAELELVEVDELSQSERDIRGHGSTGR
jgi:dUTP pyrophosphatase